MFSCVLIAVQFGIYLESICASRDLLLDQREQEKFALKTYVINVPNVGPYIVMVRPDQTKDEKHVDVSRRQVIPGTEVKEGADSAVAVKTSSNRDGRKDEQNRVEILPYKNLHFFKW